MNNVSQLVQWTHDEMRQARGAEEAWVRCHEEIKRTVEADIVEIRVTLGMTPKPSDIERSTWAQATKDYVENLERIVDSYIKT